MADFIPAADDALSTWLTTFKAKLATHAATLNITAADVTIYQNECDALIAAILQVDNEKKLLKNKVSSKDGLKTDTVGNIRTLANRIKNTASYTSAIGNDLGIVAIPSPAADSTTAKPSLSLTNIGGHLVLKFDKQKSNGVKIYGKRAAQTSFSFLALDTHSPYHDNRPNVVDGTPETRHYYAFYVNNQDEQFGVQSDVVTVVV